MNSGRPMPLRGKLNSRVAEFRPDEEVSSSSRTKLTPVDQSHQPPITYSFRNDFPRLQSYFSLQELRQNFGALREMNPSKLDDFSDCEFISVVPSTLDDVHKALKYGLWAQESSTQNQQLSELYLSNLSKGFRTLLIFKTPGGILCGVAVLLSPFQDKKFELWWNQFKSSGSFSIEWIYVKNLEINSIKSSDIWNSMIRTKDFELIPTEIGLRLMSIFHQIAFSIATSVFSDFRELDQREDLLITTRQKTELQIKLQKIETKPDISRYNSKSFIGNKPDDNTRFLTRDRKSIVNLDSEEKAKNTKELARRKSHQIEYVKKT